jgi:hypothetical protein
MQEDDDFDWIREVKPSMPAKDLRPGDRFMITQIKGKSLKEYLKDHDLREVDPYTTVFKLDDSENFSVLDGAYADYYTEGVDDIWLVVDGKHSFYRQSGWVNVHEIMVTLV